MNGMSILKGDCITLDEDTDACRQVKQAWKVLTVVRFAVDDGIVDDDRSR